MRHRLVDADDLAQERALARLEAALDRRAARSAAEAWRRQGRSCSLHACAASLATMDGTMSRRDGGVMRRTDGSRMETQWEAVEIALLYAPLSCPACGAHGEWVRVEDVPRGAMYVDVRGWRRHGADEWWERYTGPRRGVGMWICHGRQMHATQRPATRARDVR